MRLISVLLKRKSNVTGLKWVVENRDGYDSLAWQNVVCHLRTLDGSYLVFYMHSCFHSFSDPKLTMRIITIAIAISAAANVLVAQTVEGHVINAATGADLPGVIVHLDRGGGGGEEKEYSATTNSEGRFRIESVPSGTYIALYEASGFQRHPSAGSDLTLFSVSNGTQQVLLDVVKMRPLGKLLGRVKDADGRPVPNASINVINGGKLCKPPSCFPRLKEAKSNENGEYTITDLNSGPWLISATAPAAWKVPELGTGERLGWTQTFYPSVTDPQSAQPVVVGMGGEQLVPDIKLAAVPVHSIRGTVLDPSATPLGNVSVSLDKDYGSGFQETVSEDGAFVFPAVPKGEWRLSARTNKSDVVLRSVQQVYIKEEDLENVQVRLAAPFTLKGKLVTQSQEGSVAPQPVMLGALLVSGSALPSDSGGDVFFPIVSDAGVLTALNIYPGSYEVQFRGADAPSQYYLDSIRLGDRDALGSIKVLSDAELLTITYKLGGGSVTGTIKGCTSEYVFLVPEDITLRRSGFLRTTKCGKDGRFQFSTVRPGEYLGFAVAVEAWALGQIFGDADLLKSATKVTVRANEFASAEIRLTAR